ncbi:Hypothetical_protein [Hexamita inflata]|uniref:Hypothetical_protein n=1 Tax=Hexamita inflata TaxID=28002 RepID=A0AA86P7F0_9EUKA|nr:Hypothetical protein HINF_LOCUS21004 [Hexamita inflata]
MSQNYLAENIYFAQDCLILVARLKPASLFSEILFLETSRQILSRFPDYIKCKGVCKTRECVQFRSLCSLTLLNIVYIIVYIIIYIIVYKRSKSIYSLIPEARTNRHSLLFLTFRQVTFEPDSCSITFYQFFYENTCADSFLQPLNATFTMIFVQCTQHLAYFAWLKYSQSVESQMCLAIIVKCTTGLQISVELFVCLILLLHYFICECTILQCFIRLVILLSPRTNT